MGNTVNRPSSLSHLRYFILRYHRETERYELIEPNKANTYDIGEFLEAYKWFESLDMTHLGERALSASKNFGSAMAIIAQDRAFGMDICSQDPTTGVKYKEDIDELRRLYDDDEGKDDVITFISGDAAVPKIRRNFNI